MHDASVDEMVFTEGHAAQLAGVSGEQIRAWVRQGFLVPAMKGEPPFVRLYSFRDVVALRTIAALSRQGVRPAGLEGLADEVRTRASALRTRPAEAHGKIARHKHVLGNEPAFEGTRIPVRVVLAYLADGADDAEVLANYPTLVQADLDAARAYSMPRTRKRRAA